MKLRDPRMWLGAASLLLVLALFMLDFKRTSPGPISATHAQDPSLEGEQGCNLCHGSWRHSLASACGDCHEQIEGQLAQRSGFHGNLAQDLASSCERCHVEHLGRKAELVAPRSFTLAGLSGRALYDHAGLAFGLAGAHDELDCKACHANADITVLAVGDRRFLGLTQDCSACHEDPHAGGMAQSCDVCHGQEHPFAEVAAFPHSDAFPLVGTHGTLACINCHEKDGAHSVELLAGAEGIVGPRACQDCHESPHSPDFLERVADFAGTLPTASCSVCHDAAHGSFEGDAVSMSREIHVTVSGFSLESPHDSAACADCHGMGGEHDLDFVSRQTARRAEACEACHDSPHAGQFAGGAFAGEGCLACHDSHSFQPATFDVEQHQLAAFPLEGTHREVECAACHIVPIEEQAGARLFNGTSDSCEDCHADVHRGAFEQPGLPGGFGDQEGCARCHGTVHFDEGVREGFDHGLWTTFALEGVHARADCAACHGAGNREINGRAFGFVGDQFSGPPTHCASCHTDPHQGAFDEPGAPPGARNDCARCHSSESFADFTAQSFEHGRWTGFELTGIHARTACAACHVPDLDLVSAQRKYLSPTGGSLCSDCHADSHAGQFAQEGSTACAMCHSAGGPTFTELVFDHQLDSRFPLDERHAKLACSACHLPWPVGSGRKIVRYKPLGTTCRDCHGATGKR